MVHIFIVNPFSADRMFSRKLRAQLEKKEDFEYFIFNISEELGDDALVERLLKYMKESEFRLYVCGGLGTFHFVMNIMDKSNMLEQVEIGWYLLGGDDFFFDSFSKDGGKIRRMSIDELIEGSPIQIDYIRTNHGVALNGASVGMDGRQIKAWDTLKRFHIQKDLRRYFSRLHTFFRKSDHTATMETDTSSDEVRFEEIYFGNGCSVAIGATLAPEANLEDGLGEVCVCPHLKKDWLKASARRVSQEKGPAQVEFTVREQSQKLNLKFPEPITMSLDGQAYANYDNWEMKIVKGGLKFILPKDVYEQHERDLQAAKEAKEAAERVDEEGAKKLAEELSKEIQKENKGGEKL